MGSIRYISNDLVFRKVLPEEGSDQLKNVYTNIGFEFTLPSEESPTSERSVDSTDTKTWKNIIIKTSPLIVASAPESGSSSFNVSMQEPRVSKVPPRQENQFSSRSQVARDNPINRANGEYLQALISFTPFFTELLRYTDFEDGMYNECSNLAEQYLAENKLATICWFNHIYSNYQADGQVLAGLLRTISLLNVEYFADLLIPVVIAGLNNPSTAAQEAAIMVVENFRTTNALQALTDARFESKWIRRYADKVITSLESELGRSFRCC